MNGIRFTAYLSADERGALAALAKQHGTSENYLVRLAIRKMVGFSIPEMEEVRIFDSVTPVTSNK